MPKIVSAILIVLLVSACQSAYYNTMERLGFQKRDILVDRVEAARDAQQDAKTQFEDALEQFRAVVTVDAGELESTYDQLRREYDSSVTRADTVGERIDAVESVADALFSEWESELDEYSSDSLRAQSQQQLEATRERYATLMQQMNNAESQMAPVLEVFQDQVLTLKHNLNARAIAALRDEVRAVEADISSLIQDMEAAIEEANSFLADIQNT